MKLLCELTGVASDDELFSLITGTFKEKITQWSYFVNWKKVLENVAPIEKELNLLNCLVGKSLILLHSFHKSVIHIKDAGKVALFNLIIKYSFIFRESQDIVLGEIYFHRVETFKICLKKFFG